MRLAISFAGVQFHNFWTYGSKVMDFWIFLEKSEQGKHVQEPTSKSSPRVQKYVGERKEEKFGRGEFRAPVRNRRAIADQRLSTGHSSQSNKLQARHPFLAILEFFLPFFRCYEDGLGILGEWVYNTPIFWSLPLHLGGWNLPFLMVLGDFIFFSIFFC
jgi:hypothetical protein